jgi:hypothetical protein
MKPSALQSYSSLNDPLLFVDTFEAYPLAMEQLLVAEDTAYFLQRPGQKPVPFILAPDAQFEVWFEVCRSFFRLSIAAMCSNLFDSFALRFGRHWLPQHYVIHYLWIGWDRIG